MSTSDVSGPRLLVGRYRLVERLGAGGMSVVWRGFDEVLGRRRRLRAETKAAARLSHPHLTNVYDYGEALTGGGEPVPFVVMELVDGELLAAVLARRHTLPWGAAVRICTEVSTAPAAAYARGIVHRDVTPANVMLTTAGVKVVDFGISALIGESDLDPDGPLLGTPAYLAPERLDGGQVSTEPEPLPTVEDPPAAVDALVGRCLQKSPEDRPSSAELAAVLATVAADEPPARGGWTDAEGWGEPGEDTTILPPRPGDRFSGAAAIPPSIGRAAVSRPGTGADEGSAGPAAVVPGAVVPGAGRRWIPGRRHPGRRHPGRRRSCRRSAAAPPP